MRTANVSLCFIMMFLVVAVTETSTAGDRFNPCRRTVRVIYRPCMPQRVCHPCRTYQHPTCCVPAPSCCVPCVPCSTNSCVCPYYDMGGIWYGERFDWTTQTDCTGGIPGAVSHSGSPQYCVGPDCGCLSVTRSKADVDAYLEERVEPRPAKIPFGNPLHTSLISGPYHLRIRNVDREDPVYVVYYHLQKTRGQRVINFWVGWECTAPDGQVGRHAKATPYVDQNGSVYNGVVRVGPNGMGGGPQNAKHIVIRLTRGSYARITTE